MITRTSIARARSRIARAAGVLAVAAIAGLAAVGGAEAKNKNHGHNGHRFRGGIHIGYYPGYVWYGHGYGRCFYRGWDGRIDQRRHCRDYGYWRNGYHYWR